jgi:hypothetical protein
VGGPKVTRALWSAALAVGLLWPGHALYPFDGLPLNGVAEAIALGVAAPILWMLAPRFLDGRWVRVAIACLVALKIAGSILLTQQGLCARFQTAAPFHNRVLTIPIDEPNGVLRSWDVRADWRVDAPACTAIIDRPYETWSAFPAWFVNFTDFLDNPDRVGVRLDESTRRLSLDVTGDLTVVDAGRFSIDLDRDMVLRGHVDSTNVESSDGTQVNVPLEPGVHSVALRLLMTGNRWKFVPTWNGRSAFRAATLTVGSPRAADRWLAPLFGNATAGLIVALLVAWLWSIVSSYAAEPRLLAWTVAATAVLSAVGLSGRGERAAGLLLLGAVAVPVGTPSRNWRGALMLVGVPWLAFFVARTIPQVGHISVYSVDDWLTYQVAGYRIYLNGFWLEGGNKVFDFQPLYRWITGALHLVFGDSSVGEVYWDSACLLAGGLVAFTLVERVGGFRWAVGAAAVTLATFTLGTIWYFVGRGLSEIAAAGFAFFATLAIVRAGRRPEVAAVAGILAVLMFYARLNQLVFAVFLAALWLPLDVPASWRRLSRAIGAINLRHAAIYLSTFAIGVGLFALRTWWYSGVFSLLYGTSLKNNDTGLRLSTLASTIVWKRIAHSLGALVWMNEPPAPDPRALLVVAGAVLSVLALLQVPRMSRLPASIALATIGATLSSFIAHTHAYPGRMSIHLVPFAVAMTVLAVRSAFTVRLTETSGAPVGRELPA